MRKYYGGERAGRGAPRGAKDGQPKQPFPHRHIIGAQLLLGSACLALDLAAVYPLWLYLAVSWSPLLSRLRFLVEHPGESDLTVTTRSTLVERPFFAPLNFNFHFEHHCWPNVPPYRLRQAHRQLRSAGFYERHPEYANESFVGALVRRRDAHRAAGHSVA